MDKTDYLTNLPKFYTLLLLHEKPRHGYAIMDEHVKFTKERTKRKSMGKP